MGQDLGESMSNITQCSEQQDASGQCIFLDMYHFSDRYSSTR